MSNPKLNYQEQNFEYTADFGRRGEKEKASPRGGFRYARTNRPAASSHNGIHRRRNKRFSW